VKVRYKVRVRNTVGGNAETIIYGQARFEYSTNGGSSWIPLGTAGQVSVGNAGDQTVNFESSFNIGSSTTSCIIRMEAQVLVEGAFSTPSGTVDVTTNTSPWDYVHWRTPTGNTYTRRALFLGAEASKPQIYFEPVTSIPAANTLVEGEHWYDGVAHRLKYYDGRAIRGAGGMEFKRLVTSEPTNTTTTPSYPADLQIDLKGGVYYRVRGVVFVTINNTGGVIIDLNLTAGTHQTGGRMSFLAADAASPSTMRNFSTVANGASSMASEAVVKVNNSATHPYPVFFDGFIVPSADCTLRVGFRPNTSTQQVTLGYGSYLETVPDKNT
jgi:hypothetical protein